MKRIIYILLPLALCLLADCKKKQEPPMPEPSESSPPDPYTYDPETQTSKDISLATLFISDLQVMCGFLGEGELFSNFYVQIPGTETATSGTVVVIRDPQAKSLLIAFNKSKCRDGRQRSGTVFFTYAPHPVYNPNANPNAQYFRDFGFSAFVHPVEYLVDDWQIQLFDPAKPALISNKLSSASYDPALTNLSWELSGKFKLIHSIDTTRSLVWDGKILMTLSNTNDPSVYAQDKQSAIKWQVARIHYTGNVAGTTGSKAFNYNIDGNAPLRRDFNCAFSPPQTSGVTQFHPFIQGVAGFTVGNIHPRSINYGPANACDNSGTVTFRGETYNVNFE